MGRREDPTRAYYYASGQRIELSVADDLVAVDQGRLAERNVPASLRTALQHGARPLRGGVVLAERDRLDPKDWAWLVESNSTLPVFRSQGAILVVLPEVRFEDRRPAKQLALHKWLEQHRGQAEIVDEQAERVVLRPSFQSGANAVQLANALVEQLRPEMAEPRFLRIVPRPFTVP